jgi:hypothetical protein
MSVRVFFLILVCSILFMSIPQINAQPRECIPPFLNEGSYCQYRQQFSSGETYELYWEITSLNESSLVILTRSHGLMYNATRESFDIVPGGGTMVIDSSSLEIVSAYYPNGTENEGYLIGERIAFWIPVTTNETSLINSMYETNAHPTKVGHFEFDCLPLVRMCWLTKNNYSAGNWMNRYYDAETGIILMIESHLQVGSIDIAVLETLNSTNISPLIAASVNLGVVIVSYSIIIGIPVLLLSAVIVHHRRRGK